MTVAYHLLKRTVQEVRAAARETPRLYFEAVTDIVRAFRRPVAPPGHVGTPSHKSAPSQLRHGRVVRLKKSKR
jgi:hypothetical protein